MENNVSTEDVRRRLDSLEYTAFPSDEVLLEAFRNHLKNNPRDEKVTERIKELNSMSTLQKVVAIDDEDGHWYVIPFAGKEDFLRDLDNADLVDSGGFDVLWGKYMTGGDLNLVQLWAEV